MSLSPESSFSLPQLDILSNTASSNSTPPTTVADSASLHSDTSKHDVITVAVEPESMSALDGDDAAHVDVDMHDRPAAEENNADTTPSRARRSRGAPPVYNLAKLAGTDGHGKRRAKGDVVSNRRRRTIGATSADQDKPTPGTPERTGGKRSASTIDALNLQWSPKTTTSPRTRRQTVESPRPAPSLSQKKKKKDAGSGSPKSKATVAGRKRKQPADPPPTSKVPRELRRLQDTKEFSHVDEDPVVYTVWSNGKYVDPKEAKREAARKEAARKKAKIEPEPEPESEEEPSEPITNITKRRAKKYLDKGLYAGQDAPVDIAKGFSAAEKKKLAELPELIPSGRANKTMPSPMFTGLRTLIAGRDFKLPYHICNPMPPGQPKPDEWKKMTKNRFIGDSKEIWRKSPHFHDYQSKCVCNPEDGCGESCQNRIMLYECDEMNCNVGKGYCTNRAFATLGARRAKGGKYRVGVEVIKTSDRGYGVRSNRCFRPHQIIMEYAGEIITEEECERRMNEVYKDNECYYLMSFDQNMIIDATTGSIARFVNHSCNPNCRMIKWIVSGQPRMALFAGDKPIFTGDELTYDYNFDPFSAKNVQSCLCGEENCRGVLGPKTREAKPNPNIPKVVKNTFTAGKRKLQDFMGGEKASSNKAKKPRITSTKEALANVGIQMAKGTATAIKKGVSTVASSAKKATLGGKGQAKGTTKTSGKGVVKGSTKGSAKGSTVLKKKTTTKVTKAYAKSTPAKKQASARAPTGATKAKATTTVKKTVIKAAVKKTTVKMPASKAGMTSKARAQKKQTKAGAPMTAAEKKRERELDLQYEITVSG